MRCPCARVRVSALAAFLPAFLPFCFPDTGDSQRPLCECLLSLKSLLSINPSTNYSFSLLNKHIHIHTHTQLSRFLNPDFSTMKLPLSLSQ